MTRRGCEALMGVWVLGMVAGLALLQAGGGGCPKATWASLLGDPAVKQAIDQAWADTAEGTKGEKEQGGHIYQCGGSASGGGVEWSIVVKPFPADKATASSIPVPAPDPGPGCRHVGMFHTHPGPADDMLGAGSDGKVWVDQNQEPSKDDSTLANLQLRVPSFIVYGKGGEIGGITNYGWGEAQGACPADGATSGGAPGPGSGSGPGSGGGAGPGSGGGAGSGTAAVATGGGGPPVGRSSGDPHLATFDGLAYDFMAVGEFVLVRSTADDLEVQTRLEPVPGSRMLTATTAVAARLAGSDVEVSQAGVLVDGRRRAVPPAGIATRGGGKVTGGPGLYTLRWPDGTEVQFVGRSVVVALAEQRRGKVEGLLGDADGREGDDLVADGDPLLADGVLDLDEVYSDLAAEWQVTDATSRFTYAEGRTSASYRRDDLPSAVVFVDDLDPSDRAAAEKVCRDRGVVDPTSVADCVLDVVVSGDESWAAEAAQVDRLVAAAGRARSDPDLVAAAGRGDLPTVRALLAAGAAVNGSDDQGRTALHWAILAGDREVVGVLLAAGASVDVADRSGQRPLHLAAFWGFDDIAADLVEFGADPEATDGSGRTPADLAREQGHDALAVRLR